MIRRASHSGSWYSNSSSQLDKELARWLEAAEVTPVRGCRAIIAPHAGYAYSGATAAWAYKSIDTAPIRRVFILGPSHHHYLRGCALSQCSEYETPLGNLPLDGAVIKALKDGGKFEEMDIKVDEAEHSIEMHLPYIRKIFLGRTISIVPILVGSLTAQQERDMGQKLAPYLDDPDNLFIVSSDFAHWGTRFGYTFYQPPTPAPGYNLTSRSVVNPSHPIHQAIRLLDTTAMNAIAFECPGTTPSTSHTNFTEYLQTTRNTICGRHPIGVLLGALAALDSQNSKGWEKAKLEWVRYEQSSAVVTFDESSVSYASGVVSV